MQGTELWKLRPPGGQFGGVVSFWGLVASVLSPEETLAALPKQGAGVVACGVVPAHHIGPGLSTPPPPPPWLQVGWLSLEPECGRGWQSALGHP